MTAPTLAGIHHVKLPVTDLERSFAWYESRLGYRRGTEFLEDGVLMGIAMEHPNGGPTLALRLNPEKSDALGDFDYFAVGVPDKEAIEALADHLTALGEEHAGVHFATVGWILPLLHDPDGHEVRFYTHEHHTDWNDVSKIDNPRETSAAREAAHNAS